MNLIKNNEIDNTGLPFFSWECITLCLKMRKIFLVIKNEAIMIKLIKLLVEQLQTVDGNRDSAVGIKQALLTQRLAEQERVSQINAVGREQIKKQVNHRLLLKTTLKYKIIRIRSKISFIAFKLRQTIPELFLTKILESHRDLVAQGAIIPKQTFK